MLLKTRSQNLDPRTESGAGPGQLSDDPLGLLLLAGGYAQAQDYDRAEATYIAALQRAPDLAIARFQLGLLQFTSARPAVASMTWQALDRLDDRHPLKLFKTAFECLARDEFAGAIQGFQDGIAHNVENPPLNRDMQMVIDRIRALHLDAGGKVAADAEASQAEGNRGDDAPDRETQAHFLVSTYRNLN
jgi:tetratricopeptide (TPR) repeat protein